MDGRAASQTVTDKLQYLKQAGIDVVVISAVMGRQDSEVEHHQLLPWGPSGLRFDFRHLMAKRFGKGVIYRLTTVFVSLLLLPFMAVERVLFGLTHHSSWSLPAARKGIKLVRQAEFDLVYSSGGAWSAHLAAAWIKSATGVKWIAEIHDPMIIRDNADDDGTRLRRSRSDRFAQHLETRICDEADHVWWFTEAAHDYALQRNPGLDDKGFVVYPGAEAPAVSATYRRGATLSICHFGSLTDDRSLAPVLLALQKLIRLYPAMQQKLRVHLYGTNLDANSQLVNDDPAVASMIVEHGRLEHDPLIGLSGRARVTQKMFESDVLLLLHGDYEWCAEYIPSKYYEYLWARRPLLALTNRNPQFDRLLSARNAYLAGTLNADSIEQALTDVWTDWTHDQLQIPAGDAVSVESAVQRIVDAAKR
jgi:hypothetical protein